MADVGPMSNATRKSRHEMTVCNACRYCEAYCPVFQAMEERLSFSSGDVAYLANLCHNCGECLYACQYAPPHEFNIDIPRTFSELRMESYEAAAWPSFAADAFRRPALATLVALILSALCLEMYVVWTRLSSVEVTARANTAVQPADFYGVMSHVVMVTLFGAAAMLVLIALTIGYRRFSATIATGTARGVGSGRSTALRAGGDALTLRHLHAAGEDCTDALDTRWPWRRWMHHCTFYGFALCFASTSVAAVYHLVFGWVAPYEYMSVPVVLGTIGGIGLIVGPAGLFIVDRYRDPALRHPAQAALDGAFLAMLFFTSLTGLLLLALRNRAQMPLLLFGHLAFVLALFLTMPYGKFVHGIYRAAALAKFRREESVSPPA